MTVDHDLSRHRFTIRLPEGTGVLSYEPLGDRVLDLRHTVVEPAVRSKGVADALVQAALAYAREEGFRIIPACPYVRVWLARHPRDADLVVAPD